MKTYIIEDLNIIKQLTGKCIYSKVLLHVDTKKKTVKIESDYTLFELTEVLDYNQTQVLLESM